MSDNKARSPWPWIVFGVLILLGVFSYGTFRAVEKFQSFDIGEEEFFDGSGDIAIMKIDGVIMGGEEELTKLEELAKKKSIKAVVIRINSPGGAVAPSQEIYEAVARLNLKKPVVCSIGDLAASGGYYIASACQEIWANEGSLTGSIGVIMHFINLKDLYQWAKVQPMIIKAGKFKDIGNEGRTMTDDERKLLQTMLDEVHTQFKTAVLKGRNANQKTERIKAADVEEYADGRIFSGAFAKTKGFVDQLGDLEAAKKSAAKLANIEDPSFIKERPAHGRFGYFMRQESKIEQMAEKLMQGFSSMAALSLTPGVPYLLPSHMFQAPESGITLKSGAR
jgi:protease-4